MGHTYDANENCVRPRIDIGVPHMQAYSPKTVGGGF